MTSASSRVSRFLHRLGAVSAGERVAGAVGLIVTGWVVLYAAFGFPSWMASALEVVAAAVTLVMVFVIQHSQQRTEAATQLKLDELVRSSDADSRVAEIEADDDELEHRRSHRRAESG
ncbi:MAG TPA: low affinity iron permease family protein [Acidimicrobiales bacterium]